MTTLRQRMIDDMRIRNLSPHTIQAYIEKVAKFARHFGKSPSQLGHEEIRTYLLGLVNARRHRSTLVQNVCALRFLYKITLQRSWQDQVLPFPKKERRLPVVLSREEVRAFLAALEGLKRRTLFLTIYATGIRISECLHLLPADIDSAGSGNSGRPNSGNSGRARRRRRRRT